MLVFTYQIGRIKESNKTASGQSTGAGRSVSSPLGVQTIRGVLRGAVGMNILRHFDTVFLRQSVWTRRYEDTCFDTL